MECLETLRLGFRRELYSLLVSFPEGVDNSGFVGWVATHLKRHLGTGVFVICGQNSRRGGIFDYWGIPLQMRNAAQSLIDALR